MDDERGRFWLDRRRRSHHLEDARAAVGQQGRQRGDTGGHHGCGEAIQELVVVLRPVKFGGICCTLRYVKGGRWVVGQESSIIATVSGLSSFSDIRLFISV